jgi:DNA polymerase-3 subunit gamma/tau
MGARAALQGSLDASGKPLAASPEQHAAPAVAAPARSQPSAPPSSQEPAPSLPAKPVPSAATASLGPTIDANRWLELVANTSLRGPSRELAAHAGFIDYTDGVLKLSLPATDEHLKAPGLIKALADALAPGLGATPQIRFEAMPAAGETLHQRSARERDARQLAAEDAFISDPGVQQLISRHGAKVVPDSIRPFDE